jgi:outer membrane protein OmpA-like peptidoglycan-associated protein
MKFLNCATLALCLAITACSSKAPEKPAEPQLPPPAVTQAWLDDYQPRLEEALKGSEFKLERLDNVLMVTAPVDSTFNPDRPNMLMPSTLGPLSRIAKMVEKDEKVAVLILGHADSSGSLEKNRQISVERAASVTAIFRLSGLKNDRLMRKGVGPDMPRAANDSPEGRALNRRVEVVLTRTDVMAAMLAHYSQPAAAKDKSSGQAVASSEADKNAATGKGKDGKKTAADKEESVAVANAR